MKSLKLLSGLFVTLVFLSCADKPNEVEVKNESEENVGLTIDMQLNVATADKNNFTSFMGPLGGVENDFFDTTTGASAKKSTEMIANYMLDAEKQNSMPYGVRSLFLFPVAENTRVADGFVATKAESGVITVMYAHRGTAYRLTTDAMGNLVVPSAKIEKRLIGSVDQVFPVVFASDTTVKTLDWAKVWDNSVTANGVEAITVDAPNSKIIIWKGALNFDLNDNVLKVTGGLIPGRP